MSGSAGNRYAAYGRVYRVERVGTTGVWCAMGRGGPGGGRVLDRIGGADSADGMQVKLDAWARRQGLRPLAARGDAAAVQSKLAV